MAPSTFSFHPSTLMSAGSTSPRAGFPDRVILCKVPRISKLRNATTAECETSEGHTVEVSFWLVDPPGVSYFSVNCPGLDASHFDDDMDPPMLICTEAAFVLFTVTVLRTTDHFVYTAGPAGKQSLQLLPYPISGPLLQHPYALLPRGVEHYAVAFLERQWMSEDVGWQFDASIFSSETRAWRRNRVSLQHLSESEKSLCGHHGLLMQIAIGGDSMGWADLESGILLLQNLFDRHPVIRFIPFPERVRFMDEDGIPYLPDDYYCNFACCDDLIKYVQIEFDDPARITSGQGWRATMWNRNIFGNKQWCRVSTVDVDNISVDQSYSALLPELRRDDEIQRLELRRLDLHTLVPSVHNDDIVYMMAKVDDKEDTAWVIAVDMEHAAVEAMAPFSAGVYDITIYRPCVFPKYLNISPGAGMCNRVDKCFKRPVARLSAKQCLVQVLWTLDWLQELDQCLIIEASTYNTCRLLLQLSPVSSLRSNIKSMVKCASSCNGQGEAASKAVSCCLRALDDFDLALHEAPSEASVEAIRSKISDVLQALDNILRIVPPTMMPKEGMLREGRGGEAISETCKKLSNESDKWQKGIFKPSNSRVEKYQENKGGRDRKERRPMVWDGRFLILIVLLVSLIMVVMSSSP